MSVLIGVIVMAVCGAGLVESMTYADENTAAIAGGSVMFTGLRYRVDRLYYYRPISVLS